MTPEEAKELRELHIDLLKKQKQKELLTEIMEADAKDGLYDTWEDIEEEYLKDEYPVFGGPFTNAMKPFEWLKKYYHTPKRKQVHNLHNNNP